MKTLGIVGGIAPESTIDYYRLLVASYREQQRDNSYPSILINSVDVNRVLGLVAGGRLDELAGYLGEAIDRLARGGADFGLLASNTPHIVFDQLSRISPIPLLSIVEAASEATAELGLTTVGILGTRFTMEGRFYPEVFARRGIAVRPPPPGDLTYVHEKYVTELVDGNFRPETRAGVLQVIARLKSEGAEGVVLAGTELPLLLRGAPDMGVSFLDTTRIHVRRAVAELLADAM
jgi:aspartate racemase